METFSASLAFCEGNSPITGEFPSQRPVTQSFGVFFEQWVNNREAGGLRRHRAHYDVIVVIIVCFGAQNDPEIGPLRPILNTSKSSSN